jgi:hypothetical protein
MEISARILIPLILAADDPLRSVYQQKRALFRQAPPECGQI